MKILSDAVGMIRKVYAYEKTTGVDTKALQVEIYIFAVLMFLIDIRNFKMEKYAIGAVTLLAAIVCISAAMAMRHYQKNVYRVLIAAVVVLLFLAAPLAILGANDGFSLLWYMLIPIITLILMGMPFGVPVCIIFGLFVMILFWTPVKGCLAYPYEWDYLLFYPWFYWGFCLIVVVMDIFYKLYQMKQIENEENLEEEVRRAVERTQHMMVDSVAAISRMLDEKDGYTQEHSRRVAMYSRLIAQNLKSVKLTEEEISAIYRSALMHDIGKIAIPDSVLNKPERLTDEEYEIMKKHTIWGKEILSGLEFLPQADVGANYHHERYDGTGYPYGLSGEELPLMARIISAADALDAMNSDRCYRKNCGKDYIIGEFEKGSGKQFDAEIAGIVVSLVRKGRITA